MVGLSAMATALGLSVVAAVADMWIKLGLSDITQAPVDDDHRSNRQELIGIWGCLVVG
jgi:mannose/fructose/N-acetylgalactosamine-specific phosphotransferase system component IID